MKKSVLDKRSSVQQSAQAHRVVPPRAAAVLFRSGRQPAPSGSPQVPASRYSLNDVSPAERLALDVVAAACSGAPMPQVPEGMWADVYGELCRQAVACIPADRMGELGLTSEEELRYLAAVASGVGAWHRVMGTQAAVLELLEGADIPSVVLKGSAAAAAYARPEYRSMGDVDLIVRPQDFDRALALLLADGWQERPGDELNVRHVGLHKEGCTEVELHRFFSPSDGGARGRRLDGRIFAAIERREFAQVGGYRFPMLSPLENGLVLLEHMNLHLNCGIGFRHVLDWQMFVEAHLDDGFWNGGFRDACRGIGMEKLAVAATWMCRSWFGLQRRVTWCDGADAALAEELAAYVVRRGNMGRKDGSTQRKMGKFLRALRSPASTVQYLYERGRNHWEPGRRHKWLAPVTCIYQAGCVARKGIARKVHPTDVADTLRDTRRELDFLSELGVTRF